jgi:hypothetical protein
MVDVKTDDLSARWQRVIPFSNTKLDGFSALDVRELVHGQTVSIAKVGIVTFFPLLTELHPDTPPVVIRNPMVD